MKRVLLLITLLAVFLFSANAQLNSARLMVFVEITDNGGTEDAAVYDQELFNMFESDAWALISQKIIRDKWNSDMDLMSFSSYAELYAAADIIFRYSVTVFRDAVTETDEHIRVELTVSSILIPYKMDGYSKTISAGTANVPKGDADKTKKELINSLFLKITSEIREIIEDYLKSEINTNDYLLIFRNITASEGRDDINEVMKDCDIFIRNLTSMDGSIFVNARATVPMEQIFPELMQDLRSHFPDIIMRHQTGSRLVFDFIY
ncbi:MAG: hypothetical protein JW874_15290 [Spirochaetales bacterium]|nr:hypothetical protein [Spirochaetales bacterium]